MSIQVKIPVIGESVNEATVGRWLKQNGSKVEADDVLCEVESEKASMEIVAEESGLLNILVREGSTVAVGTVIAEITGDGVVVKKVALEETVATGSETPVRTHPFSSEPTKTKISPLAAKLLKESGIRTDSVTGSGVGGKVVKQDVLKALTNAESKLALIEEKPEKIIPEMTTPLPERQERRERMTTLRKTISRRLLEAKHGTAMLTTFNEIDMSAIMEVRARYKETFKEKYEVGLGFMSFFIKAATLALQEYPVINALIDGDEIVYHDYYDIGVAVSTERGLVVPVIRNAEKLGLAEIEREVSRLATRARDSKLTIDEMSGGTFSITNGGVFGSLLSTPILNTPQAAILGMHTIQERPVVRNGQIVIRPMMYVAMSYDHRLIDGRDSVTFLVRLKEILEDPIRMLLYV